MGMLFIAAMLLKLLRAASIAEIIPAAIVEDFVFPHIRLAEFPSVSATCTMFNQLSWKALITRFGSDSHAQMDYRKVYEAYLLSDPDEKDQYKALFCRYCRNHHRFNLFNDEYLSMVKSLFSKTKVKLDIHHFPELTWLQLKRCQAKGLKVFYETGLLSKFFFAVATQVVDRIRVLGLAEIEGLNLGIVSQLVPRISGFNWYILKNHIVNGEIADVEELIAQTRQFSSNEIELILQFPDLFPLDLVLEIIRLRPGEAIGWIRFLLRSRNRTLFLSRFSSALRNRHFASILLVCSQYSDANVCQRILHGDAQVDRWLEEIRSGSVLLDERHIETALLQGLPDDQVLALLEQTTKAMPSMLGQIAVIQKRSATIVEKLAISPDFVWERSEPYYFEENPSLFFDWYPKYRYCGKILIAFLRCDQISREAMVEAFKLASRNGKLSESFYSILSSTDFVLHPYFDDLLPVILEHCFNHKLSILIQGVTDLRPLQTEVKRFFSQYSTDVLLDYLPRHYHLSHVTSHIDTTAALFSIIIHREPDGARLLKSHMNLHSYLAAFFSSESLLCDISEAIFYCNSHYEAAHWIWPFAIFLSNAWKDGNGLKVQHYVRFIVSILNNELPLHLNFLKTMVRKASSVDFFTIVHSAAGYESFKKLVILMAPTIINIFCESRFIFETCYYKPLNKSGLFAQLMKILRELDFIQVEEQRLLAFNQSFFVLKGFKSLPETGACDPLSKNNQS